VRLLVKDVMLLQSLPGCFTNTAAQTSGFQRELRSCNPRPVAGDQLEMSELVPERVEVETVENQEE